MFGNFRFEAISEDRPWKGLDAAFDKPICIEFRSNQFAIIYFSCNIFFSFFAAFGSNSLIKRLAPSVTIRLSKSNYASRSNYKHDSNYNWVIEK